MPPMTTTLAYCRSASCIAFRDVSRGHGRGNHPSRRSKATRRSRSHVDVLASLDTVFLVARRNQSVLGTIAFRVIEPGHAEIKRLFVSAKARGCGLGRQLVVALENAARCQEITRLSLETGIRQPEAIGLYRSAGYRECQPFGEYKPDPLSLFMSKRID